MASAEFMAISQPAFEEGVPNSNTGMHGKPPVQTKMYFYSDSNYDFKFDVSIPSLLYKKYINNNPGDICDENGLLLSKHNGQLPICLNPLGTTENKMSGLSSKLKNGLIFTAHL